MLADKLQFAALASKPGRLRAEALLLSFLLAACQNEGSKKTTSGAASSSASSLVRAPVTLDAAERDHVIDIPEGKFWAGSVPGEPGREPTIEPRRYEVHLGPFGIDRLPFPNDPKKPFLTNVTHAEAQQRCAGAGGRLCTELEWERACKGPESHLFSGGDTWRRECAERRAICSSGFDVLGMGTRKEWVDGTSLGKAGSAPVRGAPRDAPGPAHGCARRQILSSDTSEDGLGFRCCHGAPNAATIEEPKEKAPFTLSKLTVEKLKELLLRHPRTKHLASDLTFFREPEAWRTVLARGTGDTQGFSFTVLPLLYRPVAGSEFLAVTARSGDNTSFVVVYYSLGGGEYRLASSYVMQDEIGPVAFAYSRDIRPRFHFSTCWGCPKRTKLSGETGKVLFRKPDSVVILQP